jgi:hypothetical protein
MFTFTSGQFREIDIDGASPKVLEPVIRFLETLTSRQCIISHGLFPVPINTDTILQRNAIVQLPIGISLIG